MFEQVSGIRICGGYFCDETDLMLFERDIKTDKAGNKVLGAPRQISLIYGENGCGKSSVATALTEYSSELNQFTAVELLNNESNRISSAPVSILDKTTLPLNRLFVYNESFVESNIRFTSDNKLNAIVMFDEQTDIADEKTSIEGQLKKYDEEILPKFRSKMAQFDDVSDLISPKYHFEAIRENLKANWASRQLKVTKKMTAPVRDEAIKLLINRQEKSDAQSLHDDFDDKLKIYQAISTNEPINAPVECDYSLARDIDTQIGELLKLPVEKPVFNEREQKILGLIDAESEQIQKAKEVFSNDVVDTCPFCFQPVTQSYKSGLVESIQRVFNSDAAENHRLELKSIDILPLSIDLKQYYPIDEDYVKSVESQIEQYNNYTIHVTDKLNEKSNKIYTPISNFTSSLESKVDEIKKLLLKLEQKRKSFNEQIEKATTLQQELFDLNTRIAVLENIASIKSYNASRSSEKIAKDQVVAEETKRAELHQNLQTIKAKEASIHLALTIINGYLTYIFCSTERLQLEETVGGYIVKSHGQSVKLKNLSTGERNAISICYFFSSILTECKKQDFFSEECFVVLDDPISSFDFANKIGIYSFFRYILKEILKANTNSRIVIFTHQVEAMFNLEKVCSDIARSGIAKANPAHWLLKNRALTIFSYSKHSEYSSLVSRTYEYAAQKPNWEEQNDTIGNTMRKMLEAFSSFFCKVGIEELTYNERVLDIIADDSMKEYFRNLMYRLVLHNESHLQYQAQGYPDSNFGEYATPEQKVQTAKDILVFLNSICPIHLQSHLQSESGAADMVSQWETELMSNIALPN